MKRNNSLKNIESILTTAENFNGATFGSAHSTSPPQLVFHRGRFSAEYDPFSQNNSSSINSLPPVPNFDSYPENHLLPSVSDSLPNYYEIAIKNHKLIAQQQEFERLHTNPIPSTSQQPNSKFQSTIFIPSLFYQNQEGRENFACKEENSIQGSPSPTSPGSSLYSVDLSGVVGNSPGIPLLGDSFEVPFTPNGVPHMPAQLSTMDSNIEITRKFSNKEFSASLDHEELPLHSTPNFRSRSEPPKRKRVKPVVKLSLDSPALSVENSESQGSSIPKIDSLDTGDEDAIPEIQINNHHYETDDFFTTPIKDVMNLSMISAHPIQDIDSDFQMLCNTPTVLDSARNSIEFDDQGFSDDSKIEVESTPETESLKLGSPITPAIRSAPPVFPPHVSYSFDGFHSEKPELEVISEDANEDERKHAQSISECETVKQKSLENDFPSEPEELPPEPTEFILTTTDDFGLPDEYLRVPTTEESNQESESNEEDDLFPKLTEEEKGYLGHGRAQSDHVISSRLQRSLLGGEPTLALFKETELPYPVDYRKQPSSPTTRHDRCKSYVVMGTAPDLSHDVHEDSADEFKHLDQVNRKISTSTPSIGDALEPSQFNQPSSSTHHELVRTPVLIRKKRGDNEEKQQQPSGKSLSAQPSLKIKNDDDNKKAKTAPALIDTKISQSAVASTSSSNPLQPLRKSVSTKSTVSISSLVDRFTSHRHTSDSNLIAGTPGRRSFNFKLMKFFSSKDTPITINSTVNGMAAAAEPKKPINIGSVKLKKYELKDDELPMGGMKEKELPIHHLLLGKNRQILEEGADNGPIHLGNGVVLRNMPKIRRKNVNSLPPIEKNSSGKEGVQHNPRLSLASVQESPHEDRVSITKFGDMEIKRLDALKEELMTTPKRHINRVKRTQSCHSARTHEKILKKTIPENSASPYKPYSTYTTPRRKVQKRKTQTLRRKSIHSSAANSSTTIEILQQVAKIKDQKLETLEEKLPTDKPHSSFPLFKSTSAKNFGIKFEREKKRETGKKGWLFHSLAKRKTKERPPVPAAFYDSPLPSKKFSMPNMMDRKISSVENHGLPDELSNVLKDSSTRLRPNSDRSPVTPNHFVEDENLLASQSFPQLDKPKWDFLKLFEVEDQSWINKYPYTKLSDKEKRRQNIIHEFYYTEKQHVQMIVFLQQAYQVGLRKALSENELNQLIPDVLDALLDFHLELLKKIKARQGQKIDIEKISDIICAEFESGPYTTAAINAYTQFCSVREEALKKYELYAQKYPKFNAIIERIDQHPNAKGKSFKSCLLVIASRLTKYPLLVEQIGKYDPPELKEENKRAHHAVKQFALKVDRELSKIELDRRWEHYRQNLDPNSVGRLLKEPFTVKDLVHQDPNDPNPRKVISIGTVKMQDVKTGQKVDLCMVMFDDVIVLLQDKNGTLQFFKHNDHASVIPLQTLIPREMERTNEIMLVVTAKESPDMYRLIFNTKSEVRQWVQVIKSARETAPLYVRRHKNTQKYGQPNQMGSENDPDEIAYNEKIQQWQKELDQIFGQRKNQEDQLKVYMTERMKFFDEIRMHFKKFPIKPIKEPHLIPGSSRGKIEKIRENRDVEKMKKIVREKFNELRDHRRAALDQLVETAQKARDADLVSFFDDLHDLSHPTGNQATSSTSSEENDETGGYGKKKPRRVRTYHGEVDAYEKGSIRRHTTLPKMGELAPNSIAEEEADMERQVDEEYRKLPLRMSSKARRAASQLIEENVSLRIENNKLKSEIALQELHIVSLKSRKAPVVAAEKLELLRQKKEEIREMEKRLKDEKELYEAEMGMRQKELEAKEANLRINESSLNERWRQLLEVEEDRQSLITAKSMSPSESFRINSAVNREKSPRIYPLNGHDNPTIPHHLVDKTKHKKVNNKEKK